MISLFAWVAIASHIDSNVETAILPNGSYIYASRRKEASFATLVLTASSRFCPETKATNGQRHLLEHILVEGADGDLDRRLEQAGAFLSASTLRDSMRVTIELSADQLELGIAALEEILKSPTASQKRIDDEIESIGQENALIDDAAELSSAAWEQSYGDMGLDPAGKDMKPGSCKPEQLIALHAKQFAPAGISLVIEGPIDPALAKAEATELLMGRSAAYPVGAPRRSLGGGRIECGAFGEARATPCGPFGSMDQVSKFAAALAIASEVPGSFFTYTPTHAPGEITVGRTDSRNGLGVYVDSATRPQMDDLFERGKRMATQWYERQMRTPGSEAIFRGAIGAGNPNARIEEFLVTLKAMTPSDFAAGFASFGSDKGVTVVGTR